jgi:signal transduction histidine kinase
VVGDRRYRASLSVPLMREGIPLGAIHLRRIEAQLFTERPIALLHELRTPLNAIIGFSEVLTDRMFGELNEKQEEYLRISNDDRGWRATLYTTGMEHSPTSPTGTGSEHTPWHATQRAALDALMRVTITQ